MSVAVARQYYALMKPRVIQLIVFCALIGMVLAVPGVPSLQELRLALVESGQGRIGSAVEELLLYCFHYDPTTGRYGWAVMTLVRLGGLLTVAAVLGFVVMMRRREGRAPVERHA